MRNGLLFLGWIGCAPRGGDLLGEIYVADVAAGEVRRFDAATGADRGVVFADGDLPAAAGPDGVEPAGLAWWDGALVVTNYRSGEVFAVDPDDGALIEVLYAPDRGQPPLEEPVALAWIAGALAVLGNDTRNVLLLAPGTDRQAEPLSPDPIRSGHDLARVGDELVVATSPSERDLGLLQRFCPQTGERLGHFAPYGEIEDATGITTGPDGLLYVTDWWRGEVVRYDPATGRRIDRIARDLDRPVATAFAPDGALLVLQRHSLLKIAADRTEVIADDLVMGRGIAIR